MKWWHWLILELLILFGITTWIYFFPDEVEFDFAKGVFGFALIYFIETLRNSINEEKENKMTDEEIADEWLNGKYLENMGVRKPCKRALLAGIKISREYTKHDLMTKLKDEGIVKSLKDSIISNKKLSSQEQQELCAWIECAMEFGEMLDECSKELEEAKSANEWHKLDCSKVKYAKTIIEDLLDNSDEYARQRARDYLERG